MGAGASIQQQTSEQIGDMVASIGEAYIPYKQVIIENGVNGELINSLSESELAEMFQALNITNFIHKKNIMNLFKKLSGSTGISGTDNLASSITPNTSSITLNATSSITPTATSSVNLQESSSTISLNAISLNSVSAETFKVVDTLTLAPSAIMQKICKIQGVELDPKNIDNCCSKLIPVIQLNANQPILSSGNVVYDCFISYRVFSDSDIAEKLYLFFKGQNINAFWDKKCLNDGEDWKTGFLRGLQSSKCFLSLLSTKALAPCRSPDKNHEYDNYLLEMETALNISELTNNPRYIIPITIGEYITLPEIGQALKKFTDFDAKLYSPTVKPSYPPKPFLDEIPPNATPTEISETNVQNAVLMAEWASKVADMHREINSKTFSNGDSYRGDLENGETVGFGVMTYANGDVARCQWIEGQRKQGHGHIVYNSGDLAGCEYFGEFANDQMQGYGTLKGGKEKEVFEYKGQFFKNKKHGFGKLTKKEIGSWIGDFKNDLMHGHIVAKYNDNDKFEGEYQDGKRHGQGVYKYDSGDGDFKSYEGMYENGSRSGFGRFNSRDGAWHEGTFVKDQEEGKHKYCTAAGKIYWWTYKHGKIQ